MDLYVENGVTPRLHTERLTLRPVQPSDCAAVVAALNQWSVTRWLTMPPFPYKESDFNWFLTEFIAKSGWRTWALDAGSELIGVASLTSELGYWLAPDWHGRGLMTEAAGALCHLHFAGTQADLPSGFHVGNAASERVLTKLGFQRTHLDRNIETTRGERVDIQRVALTKAAWQARHG